MKYILLGIVALVAGFIVGRNWGTSSTPAASAPLAPTPSPQPSPSSLLAPTPSVAPAWTTLSAPQRQRALSATFRWLTEGGWPMQARVLLGNKIDATLARLLELDANDTANLEAAFSRAASEIDVLRAAQAKMRLSDSGDDVIIDVPGVDPAASAAIYDRTVREIDSILGADRAALFRELAGETFQTSLGRFGLNATRFTVSARPIDILNGEEYHRTVREDNLDPEGRPLYRMGGKMTLAQLRENHPELNRVLVTRPGP